MHTPQLVAGLAALASYVAASPVEIPAKAGTFVVDQVPHGKVFKNGAVSLAKAHRKYGVEPPASVSDAAKAALTQQGSVTATPEQYDQEYLCPVTVGSNSLMLDFDTGSADLWVFSTELPSSESSGHALYTCTGTRLSGYSWSISYGDGSGASGNVFRDKVVIGAVTATSQAVEAATSVSSTFVSDTQNDGLVGLAFSSINQVSPQQQTTFFDTVKSTLPAPVFCAYLKHNAPGSYNFGYIDTTKYSGSLAYTPVSNRNGFWEIVATGYAVGTGSYVKTSIDAIADTGTSLILLTSSTILKAYYSKVSGSQNNASAGGYIFPCTATLPSFTVYINGQPRVVPGSYINYAPVGSGYCYGGIQSAGNIGFNILGDVFLKATYTCFDASVPQLGVGTQA